MAKPLQSYKRYRSNFESAQADLPAGGPPWLDDLRRQGMASFDAVGFPTATRGNERWKYTNVTPIARAEFHYPLNVDTDGVNLAQIKALAPWDESWLRLVFIDGRYSRPLSSSGDGAEGLTVANMADVVSQDGQLVERHLGRLAVAEDDGFTAINSAFLRDGAYVHMADDSPPSPPLHLVFLTTERSEPIVSYPRTLVVVGRHSRMTVVESYVSMSEQDYFTNSVVEIVAEDGAEIEHYRYLMEGARAFHVGTTRVSLAQDSTFSSTAFARGARLARNDLSVLLDAPGSSCYLNGLYLTSGSQHIDNHINIDHAKPHTTSDQFFKGILNDRSRAIFSGRVLVRPDAQKTYAKQSDKNLILSEGARVNTKPSLEIFAADVQCFHGATAGAMAEDALFYMRSRGLDEETAKALLVYGFASEIIERVRLQPLRDHLEALFSGTVPQLQVT